MRNRITIFEICFLGLLIFLIMIDTTFVSLIPRASLIRMALPFLIMASFISTPKRMRRGYLAKSLGLFVLVGALSTLFGNSLLLGGLKLLMYICVIYPLCQLARMHEQFMPGAQGLDYLLKMMLALLILNFITFPRNGSGLFTNPNDLGVFTVMTIPLALYKMKSSETARDKKIAIGAVGLCVLLSIMSKSRGSTVAIFVTLICFSSLRRSPSISRIISNVIVLALALSVAFICSQTLQEKVASFAFKGDTKVVDGYRQMMFDETMKAFTKSPWLGYGFGLSWRVDKRAERIALRTGRLSWVVGEFGNSTLAMLSGGGLALVFVIYLMIGTVLLKAFKKLGQYSPDTPEYAYVASLASGLSGMLVNAQAEAWLMAPVTYITVFFWFYCGLLLHASARSSSSAGQMGVNHILYLQRIPVTAS